MLIALLSCSREKFVDLDYYEAKICTSFDTIDMKDSLNIIITIKNVDTIPIIYPGVNGFFAAYGFNIIEYATTSFYSGFILKNYKAGWLLGSSGLDNVLPFFYRILPNKSLRLSLYVPYYVEYDSLAKHYKTFVSLDSYDSLPKRICGELYSGQDSLTYDFITFPEKITDVYLDNYITLNIDTLFYSTTIMGGAATKHTVPYSPIQSILLWS